MSWTHPSSHPLTTHTGTALLLWHIIVEASLPSCTHTLRLCVWHNGRQQVQKGQNAQDGQLLEPHDHEVRHPRCVLRSLVTVGTPHVTHTTQTFWQIRYLSPNLPPTYPICGPGSSVGIATELRAGRSGIKSQWGRDFPPVQTGPGAHPASCKMGTGSFPGVKCGRGVLLTTHPPSSAAV